MVGARSHRQADNCSAGEALKAARQRQQLSLDAVASTLRIPPQQLQSLEEGNLSVFSAEVYARGAYVKYARFLGVEGEQTYRSFLRSLSGARERVPLHLPQTASWLKRVWTPAGVLVLGIASGVLLVAGYLAWHVQTFVRLPDLEVLEPAALVLEEDMTLVRGRAEVGVDVMINGETVLLDSDGTFQAELPLRSGINVLRVEATGAAGRTRVVERRLLVPRS